jgi:uncharacterized membrane protein
MGFGNGYGYNIGYGFYGSDILLLILIICIILAFILLRSSRNTENLYLTKLIDILKEKYVLGIINADEYIERKVIIEAIKDSNPYITILLKRYAYCDIDTKEFFNIKNEIENNRINNAVCEKLAKGELSYDEYKANFKKQS